ncbi:1-acyl-sn-glycerol-3-phosphate acyltransferase [bacterium HR08]|nr:1-acyl-sn-glycerol-3-phosphate acyltransferase [bacterium HR08]
MRDRARGWAVLAFWGLSLAVIAPPVFALFLLSRRKRVLYASARFFIRIGLRLGGVRFDVVGVEKLDPHRAYLFLSNHQSLLDPLIQLVGLGRDLAFLAKKELFRWPLLNPGLQWIDCVPIDRSNRERAIESLRGAAEKLKRGVSFLAYPEGTRTPDGTLQPFRKGVFLLALEAGVPIVPVTIRGAYEVMPKGSVRCRPGRVQVIVHDPIPTMPYGAEALESLIAEVRRAIASALPESAASEVACPARSIST